MGKIKKRTAVLLPNAGPASICDIIVMLKWRHHVASKPYSCFFFNLMVSKKKKNPFFVWWLDRKIYPFQLPIVITLQASWCQLVILRTDFSIPPSHSWWILIIACAFPLDDYLHWGINVGLEIVVVVGVAVVWQCWVLHVCVCVADPLHGRPPCWGLGSVHVLVLTWVPVPQLFEQCE